MEEKRKRVEESPERESGTGGMMRRCEAMEGEGAGLVAVRGMSKWVQWRWVGLNACMLGSAMAMAHVSGEAQMFESEAMEMAPQMSSVVPWLGTVCGAMGVDSVGTLCSLCFMFIAGVSTGFWWNGSSQKPLAVEPSSSSLPTEGAMRARKCPRVLSTVGSVKQYRLKEIVDITDRFKLELGRGGQGVVYFASLSEGRGKAAVKRLQKRAGNVAVNGNLVDNHNQEVVEKEFWAELKTISKLHHRNAVALLGYCVEEDDLFLVYEFMAKGSLGQHLHPRTAEDGEGMVLEWKARMRCAVEVAQGLEYLHSHANPSLVHRDIKSGNILFDDDMNAKIADFGLSKPVISGQEPTVSKRVRGTHGYVDPVYLRNGRPCDKNDVYSYGVVLLELITGRRAIQQKLSLLEWCKDFLHTEEHVMRHILPRVVDSRMNPLEVNWDQVFEVVKIARNCIQERQEVRPTMQDVVAGLYNANCKEITTSSEFPSIEVPLNRFGSNGGSYDSFNNSTQLGNCSPSYDIKENSIRVICTIAGSRIVLRCKIWPTPRNFGLNKVEASMNGAVMWKKGLWWYNARSSREFTVGDDIQVTAEWHVALRTNWEALAPNDPRRNQGPFCIEYLALKDERGKSLVDYKGDKSPLLESTKQERKERRESVGSGSGSAGRRKSNSLQGLRRSSSPS